MIAVETVYQRNANRADDRLSVVLQGQLKSNTQIFTSASQSWISLDQQLQHFGQNPGSTKVTEFYTDFRTARISASEDNLYASVN